MEPEEELGSLLKLTILPWMRQQLRYQVAFGLVNAADYGVPQVRKRAIFIGSRDREIGRGAEEPELSEFLLPTHGYTPVEGMFDWQTLGSALTGLLGGSVEGAKYSPARAAVLENVPAGHNWRFLRDNFGGGIPTGGNGRSVRLFRW